MLCRRKYKKCSQKQNERISNQGIPVALAVCAFAAIQFVVMYSNAKQRAMAAILICNAHLWKLRCPAWASIEKLRGFTMFHASYLWPNHLWYKICHKVHAAQRSNGYSTSVERVALTFHLPCRSRNQLEIMPAWATPWWVTNENERVMCSRQEKKKIDSKHCNNTFVTTLEKCTNHVDTALDITSSKAVGVTVSWLNKLPLTFQRHNTSLTFVNIQWLDV